MILTIDVGYTCTKAVVYDKDEIVDVMRFDTDDWSKLSPFCSCFKIEKGIYSTVVELTTSQLEIIHGFTFSMMQLLPGITPIPILNSYKTPQTLGADRLAAAVGAYLKSNHHDTLVIDIGTCITYDFITASGEYLGGNISPGPSMRFKSLHQYTSRLPLIQRQGETPDFGISTETAIRSGVMNGVELEIEGYIQRYTLKYPNLFVYLTGGMHINLHNSKKNATFADDFIVPYGLYKILQYNNNEDV